MTITLMLLGMIGLSLLNVPIAIALGFVAMTAIALIQGPTMLPNLALEMFNGASSFPLLAIPLFILSGAIMNASSISRRLIAFASSLVGFVRGGLSMVSIGTSVFFAEISGSAVADVAALGTILIPAMKSRGYSKEVAAATMSSAASLAIIIPPSIPMILYAVMAQTSTVKLFVAGIVPGLHRRAGDGGRRLLPRGQIQFPGRATFPPVGSLAHGKEALWAFILPVAILGSIFGGIVTATEGAGMAVLAVDRGRRPDLSRSRFPRTEKGLHRRRHSDRGGHAAGGVVGTDRHVPHRSATAAGARPRHDAVDQQ